MRNFNKFLIVIILSIYNITLKAGEVEKVLFSIDSISYTSIDLENRKKYINLIRDQKFEENNKEFYLNDLISVLLFDLEYKKNNLNEKKINNLINEYYENIETSKLNNILDKEKIKKHIRYDFQRKIILQNLFDTQKDIIFERNKEELTEIYKINLEYYSFNNENYELLKQLMDEINYLNIKNKKNELDKGNINYIYSNKEIKFYNDINIKIKDSIKKNKKYFNFMLNKNTHIYGQIVKKLKIDKELKFTLVQIIKDNDGLILQANCNKINELRNNNNLNIKIIENVDYYKLNQTIKDNLYSLNDKIIIKDNNKENHIILCDIKYNKEDIKKINIDNRVNYLVSKIEQEFVNLKKEDFKFNKYD